MTAGSNGSTQPGIGMPARPTRSRLLAPWVFWPTAGLVIAITAFSIVTPTIAKNVFDTLQSSVVNSFSWYYVLIAAFFVAFALWLGFSRFGDIKLGKDDDEPEFSMLSWISFLFAAGMGIGLVFYGVAEPLSHFANPRPGVTGNEIELAQQAMSQTFLHWGVHAWAIYVVVGLALAYAIHRRGRPISIRWTLEPLLGKRVHGGWGNLIDVIALVGTVFGVATSLGLGVLQISAGLEKTGIAEANLSTQIIVIIVIVAFTIASLVTGIGRGMKWLSTTNLLLAAVLLVFLLIVGPTTFLFREFVQSMGNYLQNFIGLSFTVSAYAGEAGEQWQAGWTTFYWGWWMSWAPFVGVFIARVSKGRTVREFVGGVMLVPTVLTFLWFSVLGGNAIYRELYGQGGLIAADGSVDADFRPVRPPRRVAGRYSAHLWRHPAYWNLLCHFGRFGRTGDVDDCDRWRYRTPQTHSDFLRIARLILGDRPADYGRPTNPANRGDPFCPSLQCRNADDVCGHRDGV
jgi:choline/glycine/proline betaine transport protein